MQPMQGGQVTQRYLERHGFRYPIVVSKMEGLGLRLPPPDFSVKDVERYVGKEREWNELLSSSSPCFFPPLPIVLHYIAIEQQRFKGLNINSIKSCLHVMDLHYSPATAEIRC